MTDNEITEYINESMIIEYENMILGILKARQEKSPSLANDKAWFDYSDFIVRRRGYCKEHIEYVNRNENN